MSSLDATGSPISQKEIQNSLRTEQRISAHYKKIAVEHQKKFTPIDDVIVWVGDMRGGKMTKVTQHTPIRKVKIYGKRGKDNSESGIIASIPSQNTGSIPRKNTKNTKNTKLSTRYFFVDARLIKEEVVGWQGINHSQTIVKAWTRFFKFDDKSDWSIYIEDHRGQKGWKMNWECEYITFDPAVQKPRIESSWKYKEWPVDRVDWFHKGGKSEKRYNSCWEYARVRETVHGDGVVTYNCDPEGYEEQDGTGDLPLFNHVYHKTQRDTHAQLLTTETIKMYGKLMETFPPPTSFVDGEDVEIWIIDDASTYAAWLDAEGTDNWDVWLEGTAKNSAHKNLIVEVLRDGGYHADVVRLLDQNREGEATAAAVNSAKSQAAAQLFPMYQQELDKRGWSGTQVDEDHKDGYSIYTQFHATMNFCRVRFYVYVHYFCKFVTDPYCQRQRAEWLAQSVSSRELVSMTV